MFDKKKYVELQGYNKTIKSIRDEIRELKRKPSDEISEARGAKAKCTEYRNSSERTKYQIDEILQEIKHHKEKILSDISITNENINGVTTVFEKSKLASEELDRLQEKVELVDELFNEKENLENKISELTNFYQNGNDLSNKIDALYKSIKKTKDEIESLSYEIFGFDEKDEDDESVVNHVDGLKDKLEESYKNKRS